MKPADNVIALKPAKRNRAELAFLPAALEITDTPPSPIGRAAVWAVIAVFSLALTWACLGKVDMVAVAPGKIIPSGRTKIIQPFETGVVRAIHVKDGQRVSAGDPLIDLDPAINAAEQNHLKADLMAAELDIARLKAELAAPADPLSAYAPPKEAAPGLLAAQRHYLLTQAEEWRAKIAAADRQKAQKEAEAQTAKATIAKLVATIPLLLQKAEVHRALIGHQLVTKLAYLETEGKLVEEEHELEVQRLHLKEAEAWLSLADTVVAVFHERRQEIADDAAPREGPRRAQQSHRGEAQGPARLCALVGQYRREKRQRTITKVSRL